MNANGAPYTYRLLVANSLSADHYPSAARRPTGFLCARGSQKVLQTVGGEHTHSDYIWVANWKSSRQHVGS